MAAVAVTPESEIDRAWNEICRLGLQTYVADLDAHGYTVIPPEIATPNGLAERMLEAVLDIAERRNGERPDLETGSTHAHLGIETTATRRAKGRPKGRLPTGQAASHKGDSPLGDLMQSILPEDPVFEESLMNPVLLAMATYLCGYGVVLSAMGCWMKGPNETTFTMHTDSGGTPEPMPAHAYTCQCAYVLTDYNRENGSTCFVPGSHKWGRKPKGREAILLPYEEGGAEQAVPSVAKAGSMLVWHGHTWHGAFNLARRVQSHRARAARHGDQLHGAAVHAYARRPERQDSPRNPGPELGKIRDRDPARGRGRPAEPGGRPGQDRACREVPRCLCEGGRGGVAAARGSTT